MEPTSTASIKTARWFLAVLLAVNLFRAMTQSVTPGEAWNYHRFIAPPWADALASFDVNNHVVNTLLVKISTARFHLTELSLRLPSLLAGVLYLWVVFRMARRWFGDGLAFLAAIGLLTLNPLIVDALSEARGHGMALACWMWALELILESVQSFSEEKLNLAAMCLGLSVAASLAFAAPACALLAVFLVWSKGEAAPGRTLVLIAFLTAFVLLALPLNHAQWGTLGIGATSLRQTINEINALSLGTSLKVIAAMARVALALVAVLGMAAAVRLWRRQDGALVALAGATLALTLVLLMAAHRWLHTPFPQDGAIYLIPLTVLTVTATIFKSRNKTAQLAFLAVSAIFLARYLAEFPFGAYAAGRQFSGARTLAKTLRTKAGRDNVRIGASLAAEPIINYYRLRYGQGNWQPVARQPLTGTYAYSVLPPAAAALIEQRHLHGVVRETLYETLTQFPVLGFDGCRAYARRQFYPRSRAGSRRAQARRGSYQLDQRRRLRPPRRFRRLGGGRGQCPPPDR
ncbi:MAG: glycosyltransferase family 39 protein [Candidatus Solibacter sp.]|nr:glycosyltransferase family 39 protein [Candidatus Solibacter sp.]